MDIRKIYCVTKGDLPEKRAKAPFSGLGYSPQKSGKPIHSQRPAELLGAKSPGELTCVTLMESQEDPLIIPPRSVRTRNICLRTGPG